jgi:hypothetical protein
MFKKAGKFLKLRWKDKLLLAETVFALLASKCIIFIVPLRKAAPYFGKLNGETKQDMTLEQLRQLRKIRTFIEVASIHVPWTSVCLDQALAGMMLLNKRKIPNRLCLGVKKDEAKQKIEAHAWIQCGKYIPIGGQGSLQFTIVAMFAKY